MTYSEIQKITLKQESRDAESIAPDHVSISSDFIHCPFLEIGK